MTTNQEIIVNRILYRGKINTAQAPLSCYPDEKTTKLDTLTCKVDGYSCPRCKQNAGFITNHEEGWIYFCKETYCMQEDFKEIDAAFHFAIGRKYFNASLARWEATPQHREMVTKWVKDPRFMLVFVGAPNTGKTFVSVALANHFLKQKRDVRYYNTRRFFEQIQKGIGNERNQYEVISTIAETEILIFDDLGASTNSEWQREVILDLIDRRYSDEQPTIVTTNYREDALNNYLGVRTTRRIYAPENTILGVSYLNSKL